MSEPLLQVRDLRKHYRVSTGLFGGHAGTVKAIDGISFEIGRGETFGLIGESGCGKSSTVKCLLGLEPATSGEIFFEGRDIAKGRRRDLDWYRSRVQAVFQDPYSSLDPRMKVREIIAEPLIAAGGMSRRAMADRVDELLGLVGLPGEAAQRRPHEFSGGQRQRIAIARGLALEPRLLIFDEPVSALDVSIRAQILNLMRDLQARLGLSYLFISHDLDVVAYMCRRVAVMYLGKLVEVGSGAQIRNAPLHPYTQALVSAVLPANPDLIRPRIKLRGPPPSPIDPPSGCHFHTRCQAAMPVCAERDPGFVEPSPGRFAACHLLAPPASGAP